MINLYIVQAENGDCFILESRRGKKTTTILIDGGPSNTFEKHLKPTLKELPSSSKLDLVILSHIDNDHIIGLIDLLAEIKNQRDKGINQFIKIGKLWHNSFDDLLQLQSEPTRLLKNNLFSKNLKHKEKEQKKVNTIQSIIMKGFQQGGDLSELAKALKVSVNPGFKNVIAVNEIVKSIRVRDITFQILGPTKQNLNNLRAEWKDWHRKKKILQEYELGLLQILDKSVPNLASIMFLAEISNRKILFTGDALGTDVISILSKNRMLNKKGKFYVDVLKVPHHGSDRNVSEEFFNTVFAEYYIISANGKYDNPSYSTLKWIIDSKRYRNKMIKIVVTNVTPVIRKILDKFEPLKYNYKCITLDHDHHLTITLK